MKTDSEAPVLYEFGGFRLDRARRLLAHADGTAVPLASRSFDALLYLVEHAGRLVPRAELTKAVWPTTVVEDSSLNKAVSALREALGEREDTLNYLVTVPGRGYQFVAAVRRIALDEPAQGEESTRAGAAAAVVSSKPPDRALHRHWFGAAASAVAVVLAGVLAASYLRAPAPLPEMRVQIATLATPAPSAFAISPDGRRLVFVGERDRRFVLWLRELDSESAEPLSGTEDARHPFWSPDGRSVGFFTNDKLKRVDVDGSVPQTLADAVAGLGGSWSGAGTIVFAAGLQTALVQVPAVGGQTAPATELDVTEQTSHRFPHFLPDGRRFLFLAQGTGDSTGLYLGSLDSLDAQRIAAADSRGVYLATGWLLFVRAQTLLAQRFDVARGRLTGDPVVVASSVALDSILGTPAFSASDTGLIAYRSSGSGGTRQLAWFDRSGAQLGTFSAADSQLSNIALSPDGSRVAVERDLLGDTAVWILDGTRATRVTSAEGFERFPVWSSDGTRLAFSNGTVGGPIALSELALGGTLEPRVLWSGPEVVIPCDLSPDGRFLLYFQPNQETETDLWVLPLQPNGEPAEFLKTPRSESWGQFSPDGRWVAYQTNETGQFEVVVRPFPGPGAAFPVSTSGGVHPRWSADGTELYYIRPDGALMAVPVNATAGTFSAGTPAGLFQSRRPGGGGNVIGRSQQYDVAADGRFLVNTEVDAGAPPITLLVNWRPPE